MCYRILCDDDSMRCTMIYNGHAVDTIFCLPICMQQTGTARFWWFGVMQPNPAARGKTTGRPYNKVALLHLMDRNEGAKRCCIRLGCVLRNESLNHRLINPDQLTTPHTARLPTTLTTATTYIDDSIYRKHHKFTRFVYFDNFPSYQFFRFIYIGFNND